MSAGAAVVVVFVLLAFALVAAFRSPARRLRRATRGATETRVAACGLTWCHYSNAFDTGPSKCPFCGDALRMLRKDYDIKSPNGTAHTKDKFAGNVCLTCGVAAKWDLAKPEEWHRIEDYAERLVIE